MIHITIIWYVKCIVKIMRRPMARPPGTPPAGVGGGAVLANDCTRQRINKKYTQRYV